MATARAGRSGPLKANRPIKRPAVAIVGAGFSGLLTALRLLEQKDGPRIHLIERRSSFARGVAYSTACQDHLLNVRASNMSAFPEEPDHFLKWLSLDGAAAQRNAFVSRARYGDYLQSMLIKAAETAEPGRLILETDEAVELKRQHSRWRLSFVSGRTIPADVVVLAMGNFAPRTPKEVTAEVHQSPLFATDPWTADFSKIRSEGTVVLVGSGLTMVDMVTRLADERPNLKFLAVSRRGLLPRRHLEAGPTPLSWRPTDESSVLSILREVRSLVRGAEWRAVLDGLRPHVQRIWRNWPADQRARFLRHVRPWWDVHRHRLAPEVSAKLDQLTAAAAFSNAAGRLQRLTLDGDGILVDWLPRGECSPQTTRAAFVVNCSGPGGPLVQSKDAFVANLAMQGLIRSDELGLGIDVDAHGRPISKLDLVAETIFSIGPVTRGAFWEITSVPDIRNQVVNCVHEISTVLDSGEPEILYRSM